MRILVADDELVARRMIESALRRAGHEVNAVDDGAKAWKAVQENDFDILVLDWMMPELDGVALCKKIREHHTNDYLYIIILTAKVDHSDVVIGLDAGADDFLTKPFNPEALRARIRAGERIVNLERSLIQANIRLDALASTDELTGLMNRRAILSRLEEEVIRGERENKPVCAVMIDLDHFKQINDTHGHAVGDEMLKELARRVSLVLRPYDSFGRIGGDEFLLIIPGCDETQAAGIAGRLREAFASELFTPESHGALPLTGSFGVAEVYRNGNEISLYRSDEALYEVKRRGGNGVCMASAINAKKREEISCVCPSIPATA